MIEKSKIPEGVPPQAGPYGAGKNPRSNSAHGGMPRGRQKSKIIGYFNNQNGTFLIDSLFLLPWIFGPFIAYITVRHLYRLFGRKKWFISALFLLTICGFWLIAGGLYFDYISPYPLSKLGGNAFMWNWPFNLFGATLVKNIPTYTNFFGFWNILALFLFAIAYPLMLWIGIKIGYLFFGRSEKQKGVVDLLFKRFYKSEFN